ncbi:MAG: flagellar basal body P-ring protein FlgI [Candidatus Thiodiazotropha sp. (ex Dulcina madagascariensis)]|nr:flagellar basal body P-ring protein FlgI [Candidatus Thiodiazotropha sp. (ex Epidulcina cf. delphinae)]MCU7922539.1 flagellar basal body P-ring protein FlgI [Candidatus Thiodiazotropha sp. (ex Dulcina madagascariensis)]MCU7925834.1 flagellar basal body P-ring protein FlgI [Candidatus Thiodiazotropha sp. (ex Dulcina madagascariensis)]
MKYILTWFCALGLILGHTTAYSSVRIKDLCRIANETENALVGYGLVTGLAGTGDTARSIATTKTIKNILQRLGLEVDTARVRSQNVAAVMLSSTLPPYSEPGDKIDVNVTSLGDARSLVGGTLLLTHLTGADGEIYALAQGPVSIGGFRYDLNGNIVQKNHPTAGNIPQGATVEKNVATSLVNSDGYVNYVLFDPDFTTASRVATIIKKKYGYARAINASRIEVKVPDTEVNNIVGFLMKIESLKVNPDNRARIVVNERTGTIVSGGAVMIEPVSITHGDIKVVINTEYDISQPAFLTEPSSAIQTVVVPKTTIEVDEEAPMEVVLDGQTSVASLVSALGKVRATSRDIISILQTIKRAGALHAKLIIQ